MPEIRAAGNSMGAARVVLFCILAGSVATFARGYSFGMGNQVGQLALVFRQIDPSYLPGDAFLDATAGEHGSPRYYYVKLLAALATCVSLPAVCLMLTCLAKIFTAAVTFRVADKLFDGSKTAAILAVALVLSVDSITLGNAADLSERMLLPSLLARPLALASLWLAINRRVFWCLVPAAAATAIHPLVGFETAGVGLAVAAWLMVCPAGPEDEGNGQARLKGLATTCAAAGILLAIAWVLFGGAERTLGSDRFVEIYAEVRNPHHLLPSVFGLREYCWFVSFLVAAWISWTWWKREKTTDPAMAQAVLGVNVVVLAALTGGYLFVEVFPSRLWATAQTFRMVYLIKWLGLVLFAGTAGRLIGRSRSLDDSVAGWCMLMGTGPFQPMVVLAGHVLETIRRPIVARLGPIVMQVVVGLTLVGVVSAATAGDLSEAQSVVLIAGLGFWYLLTPQRWLPGVLPVAIVGIATFVLTWDTEHRVPIPRISRPVLTLDGCPDPAAAAAAFAKANTPPEAIFLTPPHKGIFRLLAQRAIVVDRKVLWVSGDGISQWYQRMAACYGDPDEGTLPDVAQLDAAYGRITDDRIRRIARDYDATHALLVRSTSTQMPVLYQDDLYKIVQIRP